MQSLKDALEVEEISRYATESSLCSVRANAERVYELNGVVREEEREDHSWMRRCVICAGMRRWGFQDAGERKNDIFCADRRIVQYFVGKLSGNVLNDHSAMIYTLKITQSKGRYIFLNIYLVAELLNEATFYDFARAFDFEALKQINLKVR